MEELNVPEKETNYHQQQPSNHHMPEHLDNIKGIIQLNGLIFLETDTIKENNRMVQETFTDLYNYLSEN